MQLHRNSFEGGLNTDVSKNLLANNTYVDAQNVNLSGTNNFFALENIRGTRSWSTIIPYIVGNGVSGVFASKYKIGDSEDVDCLTIFTYTELLYTIWCYDTVNNVLYKLFEDSVTDVYSNADPIIDAIVYSEGGLDILYFTDNINEIRKLKCEIPDPYVAGFLTESDLKLLQQGANGSITTTSVDDDGTLFCGSYQFAYQLVNIDKDQYSKFSLFSNPVQVFLDGSTTNPKSGIGLPSKSSINLTITPSAEEIDHYTHFRLAVIENIFPSEVNVSDVQLTKLEAISDYLSGTDLVDVIYSNNTRIETLALSEIVVDKLAIETFKTLTIRDNRLIGGNVTYKDLSYNHPSGDPVITGGSILKQTGDGTYDNLFCDQLLASKYRGYFRDEVYRFAISYFDGNGNFSFPKVLDLSSVTHNQISGAYKDMKFPDRSQNISGTTYTLFSETEGIQSLGLQLTGISNHPRWAKGFVILRANRIKDILFQTPLIPMNKLEAIGAVEKYPYGALELSGVTTKTVEYPDAQPMGPFVTNVPRNYFYLNRRDLITNIQSAGGAGTINATFTGESKFDPNDSFNLAMLFPPSFMYEDVPFLISPNHKLVTVDAALTRGQYSDYSLTSPGTSIKGLNIRTSVAATFYALRDTQYYYNATHNGAKATIGGTRSIRKYTEFDNLSSGAATGGINFFNYDHLETNGIKWGTKAETQKCGVAVLDSIISEINYNSALSFSVGSQISHTPVNSAFYLTDGTLVHTFEIVNVTNGLTDTRYGSYDTPHDFISTGTIYTFSEADLTTVAAGGSLPITVDVWGGDCYVSPHLFKITDTVYGPTNNGKYDGTGGEATSLESVENWTRAFNDDATNPCAVSVPVPFKNAASFVQIVLESEYNAGVMDTELINVLTTDGTETVKMPVYGLNSSNEVGCRVPLTYNINTNHKKTNSNKIFRIKDPLVENITELGSRFVYSDQKIYQTSIVGFDTFRVLNYKDLEERYGDITKLVVVGNDLYALQESAISYIGIGERTLETTDQLTLAVQSGSFIGNIITLDNTVGTQHPMSVLNTGALCYFMDNRRKGIYRINNRKIENLSHSKISSLLDAFVVKLDQDKLRTLYDPEKQQCWFVNIEQEFANDFCLIFDETKNMWVSNYEFPSESLFGGAYTNQRFWLIGKDSDSNITVHDMNLGDRSELFGVDVTPSVSFVINPISDVPKVFNDIFISANDRLDELDLSVVRESLLGNQTISGITLDTSSRGEGNFRAKVLRDSSNARARGLIATATIKWKTGDFLNPAVYIPSVITQYLVSK